MDEKFEVNSSFMCCCFFVMAAKKTDKCQMLVQIQFEKVLFFFLLMAGEFLTDPKILLSLFVIKLKKTLP